MVDKLRVGGGDVYMSDVELSNCLRLPETP